MADVEKTIAHAFREMTAAADRLTSLVEARTSDQRRLIIRSRPDMSNAVFDLGRAVDRAAKDGKRIDAAIYRQFRAVFHDAHHSIALHQAEWPVSGISRDEDAYVLSSRRAREAKDRLVDFVRSHLLDADGS